MGLFEPSIRDLVRYGKVDELLKLRQKEEPVIPKLIELLNEGLERER
jgi:hypothetical protein